MIAALILQAVVAPPPVDPAQIATKADIQAIQQAMPQPATTVGAGEVVGGQVGSSMRYKREDWVPPRRSRTGSCVLSAGNTCTLAWTSPFVAGETPVMLGGPVAVNSGATQPIDCDITAAPTIAGVPIKCWIAQATVLSLSAVTTGITVLPFSATSLVGTTVTAAAIPGSQ